MSFLIYVGKGLEPERVAALSKQSSGLFVASESLSDSESQSALALARAGVPSSAPIKDIRKDVFFVYTLTFKI